MNSILKIAIQEEENRRKSSYQELKKLELLVKTKNLHPDIIDTIKQIIELDIGIITNSNNQIKQYTDSTFALKTNKLLEILECTKEILSHETDSILAISGILLDFYPIEQHSRTILEGTIGEIGEIINNFGTSKPNCIQNTYITILRKVSEANSILDIKELASNDIYQVNHSPNIQTAKFPENFNYTDYSNWFYYYSDELSPKQGELLLPNLGYAFGGSREDSRYFNKQFRTEDCSSSLAKWLGAQHAFSTANMINWHVNYFSDNDNATNHGEYYESAKNTLTPINATITKNISYIPKGAVFAFRGHTGLITNIYPEFSIIETLSYSRDMYKTEGFGYKNYTYSEGKITVGVIERELFFFEEKVNIFDNINLSDMCYNDDLY